MTLGRAIVDFSTKGEMALARHRSGGLVEADAQTHFRFYWFVELL